MNTEPPNDELEETRRRITGTVKVRSWQRPLEDRLAAQRFLVRLLAAGENPAPCPELTPEQWGSFVEEAGIHRVAPLAWRRLSDLHSDRVPDHILERLRPHYLRNAFRNALLFRQTAEAAGALSAEGIPVMLLKGIHLARFLYEEPALRSMADIDVMVPRDRIRDADRVLVEMGYGPLPRPDINRFLLHSNHLPPLEKDGGEVVEIHYDIERPNHPFSVDAAALWNRARLTTIDHERVFVPATEHLLITLCLHLAYHHRFGRAALKGLVDIATVIRRGDLDWSAVARTANEWKAGAFVYVTLRLVRDVLQADVPETTLDELHHEPVDDDVVVVARRYILTPGVDVPDFILWMQRTPTRLKRLSLFIRGVFLPPDKLRRMYGLRDGSPLAWAFYPVRVADLLRQWGGLLLHIAARTPTVTPLRDRRRDRRKLERWIAGTAPPARATRLETRDAGQKRRRG